MKDICIQKPQVELKMRLIALLEEIKRVYPDQEIVVKIPGESVNCKLGDSEVYEDDRDRVVVDCSIEK